MNHGLRIEPATPDRWGDLVALFGPNGAYSNCWCTWWMLPSKRFDETPADERRAMLRDLVAGGKAPGLLAYDDEAPVGWVAVGPRTRYARMMSSRARVYGPLDIHDPGWVVNCFYVPRTHRRRGVAGALLEGAVRFAFENGATHVVGHPVEPGDERPPASGLFQGTLSMFLSAGFGIVERRHGRPVVRIDPQR